LGRLKRSERSDSFVMIEEVESKKCMQIVSNHGKPLLLDMPCGDMIREYYSFNMSIGSPEEAAQIATAIFREIYVMPESIEL